MRARSRGVLQAALNRIAGGNSDPNDRGNLSKPLNPSTTIHYLAIKAQVAAKRGYAGRGRGGEGGGGRGSGFYCLIIISYSILFLFSRSRKLEVVDSLFFSGSQVWRSCTIVVLSIRAPPSCSVLVHYCIRLPSQISFVVSLDVPEDKIEKRFEARMLICLVWYRLATSSQQMSQEQSRAVLTNLT